MSARKQLAFAAAAILFLGFFLMKFHMDNANDSETQAYVGSLISSASHATLAQDATGHYTALAPYVMWPITVNLELITGAYLIRGLATALFLLSAALMAAAYAWYRALGSSWLTSMVGLLLLSTSVAFAQEVRGWEIDKLLEPVLFLLAALAARRQQWPLFTLIAVVAALNRETGIFVPFVAFVAPGSRARRWPFWLTLVLCSLVAVVLRLQVPAPDVRPWTDLNADRLVAVLGGFCLTPVLALLALLSFRLRLNGPRLLLPVVVTLVWALFVLGTDRLDQGAVLLAPLAVVWLPATLLGFERTLGSQTARVPAPATPAG